MTSETNSQVANALRRVHRVAPEAVVQSKAISRLDREILTSKGWLHEIIKGWYLLTTPDAKPGDTVLWHSSYWSFIAAYLGSRFGNRYCLSAETSLDVHTGKMGTPQQLMVTTQKGSFQRIDLPFGSSILVSPNPAALPAETEVKNGVRVYPLGIALARTTPTFFRLDPLTAEIAVKAVRRDDLSRALLIEWNASAAGRLIGALTVVKRDPEAKSITADLEAAGYKFSPVNPFEQPPVLGSMTIVEWPHVGRIVALWQKMREQLLVVRPKPPEAPPSLEAYLKQANAAYGRDAYNSLSIEGYRVTPELIARVASGEWDTSVARDKKEADAMAARGYYIAHEKVLESISRTFRGEHAGVTLDRDLADWYRALFSPSVQAGILEPGQLAGYRERAVYITKSSHVPPQKDAVPACMEIYFKLLKEESDAWVRAILGHFIFVYIHPYSDGNGRLGRFIMNLMLASGGHPWTVIRNERRDVYMAALEEASMNHAIESFSKFVAEEMAVPAVK